MFINKEVLHYCIYLGAKHSPLEDLEEICDIITDLLLFTRV